MKKRMITALCTLVALAMPVSASAACYADYKAKKDNPLRLHYGVAKVPDSACGNRDAAAQAIIKRLKADGWQLLRVLSLFGPEGLDQREDSAGRYFLRY